MARGPQFSHLLSDFVLLRSSALSSSCEMTHSREITRLLYIYTFHIHVFTTSTHTSTYRKSGVPQIFMLQLKERYLVMPVRKKIIFSTKKFIYRKTGKHIFNVLK